MKFTTRFLLVFAAITALIISMSCSGRDPTGLEMARAKIDPLVFGDDYSEDVYFQAFFQTNYTAVQVDSVYAYGGFAFDGARSLKVNVAPEGSALGGYTGGVLTSIASRDLADFNALTFYARSDAAITLNEVGFGNDNTGTSLYGTSRIEDPSRQLRGIALTRDWTFFVVPIPSPSKLISERGLFTFAEGVEAAYPDGYDIWFDEIRFAKLDNITIVSSSFPSVSGQYFIGSTVTLQGATTTFNVDGDVFNVAHSPDYYEFVSSDPSVAIVKRGEVRVVGTGSANITATLQDVAVNGTVTLTGNVPPSAPAPSPTVPAGDVISLFSDVYDDVPVDTWRANWGGVTTQVQDYEVAGNDSKMYSSLNWVGIEFRNPEVDASAMTYFHLDIYAPEGTNFKVKLVSFPPELSRSVETLDLVLDANSTPAFNAGTWSSLEIPLTEFQLPVSWDWAHIGQLVLSSSDAKLVLVDNLYWHK